eukprot:scaffold53797_cov66-Phaeocystis_antarctica.AAC.1
MAGARSRRPARLAQLALLQLALLELLELLILQLLFQLVLLLLLALVLVLVLVLLRMPLLIVRARPAPRRVACWPPCRTRRLAGPRLVAPRRLSGAVLCKRLEPLHVLQRLPGHVAHAPLDSVL